MARWFAIDYIIYPSLWADGHALILLSLRQTCLIIFNCQSFQLTFKLRLFLCSSIQFLPHFLMNFLIVTHLFFMIGFLLSQKIQFFRNTCIFIYLFFLIYSQNTQTYIFRLRLLLTYFSKIIWLLADLSYNLSYSIISLSLVLEEKFYLFSLIYDPGRIYLIRYIQIINIIFYIISQSDLKKCSIYTFEKGIINADA